MRCGWFVGKTGIMSQVDYLRQNKTESLILGEKMEVNAFGVYQEEDVVLNKTAVTPANVQQMLVIKTEVPWSCSLDQQDPELLHIKEEEEELWSRQDEEKFCGRYETECSGILFSPVKIEEDEDKPQLLQLHQIKTEDSRETEPPTCSSAEQVKTETDEEDCGGPELDRNEDPNVCLQSNTDGKVSDSSETDDDDYSLDRFADSEPEGVLKLSGAPESENDKKNKIIRVTQQNRAEGPQTAEKTCKGCKNLAHIRSYKGEKPIDCGVCRQQFRLNYLLNNDLRNHTGKKPFACGVCGKNFKLKALLKSHYRIHIEDKPYDCGICGKTFRHSSGMKCHMRTHAREKRFKCSVCNVKFLHKSGLENHMRGHKVRKTFTCEYCDEKLYHEADFNDHMMDHKQKMPFSCNDCGKLFRLEFNFKRHLMGHRGEKAFDWDFFEENI